jgi:hypothetical protein
MAMEIEHIDWMEFALKMAEAARAKLAEDRKQLEKLRSQLSSQPAPAKAH